MLKFFVCAAAFAFADPIAASPIIKIVDEPLPCWPAEEARAELLQTFGEVPYGPVRGADGVVRELLINPDSGTFSLMTPRGDELCLAAYGQTDAFIAPQL